MASLNPEAPEFFPTKQHKLDPICCPNFPSSIFTPHTYYPFYYPTSPPPPPPSLYVPFVSNHQRSSPEPETNTNTVAAQEVHQQKVAVAKGRPNVSKEAVHNRVLKAWISCGRVDGRRWGKVGEVSRHNGHVRNHEFRRHVDQHYLRALPKKKQHYPLVPMRDGADQTTVMIRNIPSKYSRKMLVEFLENHCKKENEKEKKEAEQNIIAFDFVYLPIDFITGFNKGYAFVNFTNPKAALKFFSTASNAKWSLFQSHKTREVVAARLQGKEQLEKHFEAMNFPCISEGVLPVSFSPPRDGVIKGKQRTIGKVMRR